MTAPFCANCGRMLMRPWWDAGKEAYECQQCHHLTDLHGQDRGVAKSSLRSSGVVFVALVGVVLVVFFVTQMMGN